MTDQKTTRQEYNIQGMHCASCALTIEGNLKKLKGVKNANVNFATQKATVEYDEQESDDQKIVETIKKSGYQAKLAEETEEADQGQALREKEIREERSLFI